MRSYRTKMISELCHDAVTGTWSTNQKTQKWILRLQFAPRAWMCQNQGRRFCGNCWKLAFFLYHVILCNIIHFAAVGENNALTLLCVFLNHPRLCGEMKHDAMIFPTSMPPTQIAQHPLQLENQKGSITCEAENFLHGTAQNTIW